VAAPSDGAIDVPLSLDVGEVDSDAAETAAPPDTPPDLSQGEEVGDGGADSGGFRLITSISAAWNHTCVVVNGGVYCWGGDDFGMLGNNSTTTTKTPTPVVHGQRFSLSLKLMGMVLHLEWACRLEEPFALQVAGFIAYGPMARKLLQPEMKMQCGLSPVGKEKAMFGTIVDVSLLLVMWGPVLLSPGRRKQPTGVARAGKRAESS
jgi:hypothetical protein